MKSKIIGVGKCGCRVCYDLFAFVSRMPTSYKIRVDSPSRSAIGQLKKGAADSIRRLQLHFKIFYHEAFGRALIADMPGFYTVDSDTENNEIFKWITLLSDESGKDIIFPGKHYPLSDRKGGCDHHITSENICLRWEIPDRLKATDELDILVATCSIGGGTGGGASPVLLRKADSDQNRSRRPGRPRFLMILGVLPKSDQVLSARELAPAAAEHEKYSVGRFFSGFYGKRSIGATGSKDYGLWLLSNDLLRSLSTPSSAGDLSSGDEIRDPNISLINRYFAAAFTCLSNSSSEATISDSNLDAQELKNRLDGRVFLSGFGLLEADVSAEASGLAWNVSELLLRTLSAGFVDRGGDNLYGLSIPLPEDDLEPLLAEIHKGREDGFRQLLSEWDYLQLPVEFRTAREILVVYGQASKTRAPRRASLLVRVLKKIFGGSKLSSYEFRHTGSADMLLLVVVDPFVRVIQNAMYYYLARAWWREANGDPTSLMDAYLTSKKSKPDDIASQILEQEAVSEEDVGRGTLDYLESIEKYSSVDQNALLLAFLNLREKLQWKLHRVSPSAIR